MNPRIPFKDEEDGGTLLERLALDYLSARYHITKDEILELAQKKKTILNSAEGIPLAILVDKKLSGLEAIVKYLREQKKYSYRSIGQLLKRNPKTLAVSYRFAKEKKPEPFAEPLHSPDMIIPFSAFDSGLSILESICVYLQSRKYTQSAIARMLDKDPRTIWTVCARAEKKLHPLLAPSSSSTDIPADKTVALNKKYDRRKG